MRFICTCKKDSYRQASAYLFIPAILSSCMVRPPKIARRNPKAQLREIARDGGAVHASVAKEVLTGQSALNFSQESVRHVRVAQQSTWSNAMKRSRVKFLLQGLINIAEGRKGSPNEVKGGWVHTTKGWIRNPNPSREKSRKVSPSKGRKVLERYGLFTPEFFNGRNARHETQLKKLLQEIAADQATTGRPDSLHAAKRGSVPRGVESPKERVLQELLHRLAHREKISKKQLALIAKKHHLDKTGVNDLLKRLTQKKTK